MDIVKKPSFILVGTAKAGTTTIYNILKRQEELYLTKKDTFYFCSKCIPVGDYKYPYQRKISDVQFSKEEYYNSFKKGNKKVMGEISTAYLYYYEEAIPKILQELGNEVKIIIVLRNPVKRTFSGYTHFKRDLYENLDFREALNKEDERLLKNWDFMWAYKGLSLYAKPVEAYLKAFKNVKILFFEDLIKNEFNFMKNLSNFIGIENYKSVKNEYSNSAKVPKSVFIQKLIVGDYFFKRLLKKITLLLIPETRINNISKKLRNLNKTNSKYKLELKEKNELELFFKEDVNRLNFILKDKNNCEIADWIKLWQ
jgi:hypothetical protein